MKTLPFVTSLINQKGGVGKTISSVHLSAELASADHKVLLLDMDLQHGLTSYFDVDVDGPTMADVLRGTTTLGSTIIPVRDNLFLAPSTSDMSNAEMQLVGAPGAELRLRRALQDFQPDGFDFIFLDCPSGWGNITRNSVLASDLLIIPINCDDQGARLATTTKAAALELAALYGKSLTFAALLTCWRETNAARVVAEGSIEEWGAEMFTTRIRRAEKINELTIRRETLSDVGKTPVGEDYAQLAHEFLVRVGGK